MDEEEERRNDVDVVPRDSILSILKFWFGVIHGTSGFFLVFIGTVSPYWAVYRVSGNIRQHLSVWSACTLQEICLHFPGKDRRYTAGTFEIFAILSGLLALGSLMAMQFPIDEKIKKIAVEIPRWAFLAAFIFSSIGFLAYAAFGDVQLGWSFWVVCLGSLCFGFATLCFWFP